MLRHKATVPRKRVLPLENAPPIGLQLENHILKKIKVRWKKNLKAV